ncbi:MAG: SpoIID/LytB domain-containing protein [Clostridiales bacterium]|jgi:stage II sporulation protein D|nr:SpoIID/LytB domain-containing protein [Clostridiales bacterium]
MNRKIYRAALAPLVCLTLLSCAPAPSASDPSASDPVSTEGQAAEVYAPGGLSVIEPTADPVTYDGDSVPVSRALVAKMAALIGMDGARITGLPRSIKFADTSADKWYDKYINAAVSQGYMSGAGEVFMPEQPLTLRQAQYVLDKICGGRIKIQLTGENDGKAISYALWTELFMKALEETSGGAGAAAKFGITRRDAIVLATPGTNAKLPAWRMVTDSGLLSFDGLSMDAYVDKKVSLLTKGRETVAYLSLLDESPTIHNAYIVGSTSRSITLFAGGAERVYACAAEGVAAGMVLDVKINGRIAENVTVYPESAGGTVKRVTPDTVELADGRKFAVTPETRVYSVTDGAPRLGDLDALTVGGDAAEFAVSNGTIRAAMIKRTTLPEHIRVAISTSGFAGLTHTGVTLTSDAAYTVNDGSGERTIAAGEPYSVMTESDFKNGATRIYVKPSGGAKLAVTSVTRAYPGGASPKYRGVIEISLEKDGFCVVNETTMDEYLYAVVPSEMPTGYGVEAAKAQAVAARSYAYIQYYANRFRQYGANVDDSVSCQVYNNIPENDTSIQAVDATRGQCLTYDGVVISANYFAASCGMTANNGEVWAGSDGALPTDTAPYLAARKQYVSGDYGDLSDEGNAAAFLKNDAVESYDSKAPWFRWTVRLTREQISRGVNASLAARYAANPNLILTLDSSDGVYKSAPVSSVGDVRSLAAARRGEGGNIIDLEIAGSENTVLIRGEYNIRSLLSPSKMGGVTIKRKNGSDVADYAMLPSAFVTFELGADGAYTLYGGGCGHGVGMSQDGAAGMIGYGYTAMDILAHYYPGTVVRKMY